MAGYTHTSCVLDRGLDEVTRRPIYNYICVPLCNYAFIGVAIDLAPHRNSFVSEKMHLLPNCETGVSLPSSRLTQSLALFGACCVLCFFIVGRPT